MNSVTPQYKPSITSAQLSCLWWFVFISSWTSQILKPTTLQKGFSPSRPAEVGSWASWSSGGCPCLWQEVGLYDLQGPFQHSSFYGSVFWPVTFIRLVQSEEHKSFHSLPEFSGYWGLRGVNVLLYMIWVYERLSCLTGTVLPVTCGRTLCFLLWKLPHEFGKSENWARDTSRCYT